MARGSAPRLLVVASSPSRLASLGLVALASLSPPTPGASTRTVSLLGLPPLLAVWAAPTRATRSTPPTQAPLASPMCLRGMAREVRVTAARDTPLVTVPAPTMAGLCRAIRSRARGLLRIPAAVGTRTATPSTALSQLGTPAPSLGEVVGVLGACLRGVARRARPCQPRPPVRTAVLCRPAR